MTIDEIKISLELGEFYGAANDAIRVLLDEIDNAYKRGYEDSRYDAGEWRNHQ